MTATLLQVRDEVYGKVQDAAATTFVPHKIYYHGAPSDAVIDHNIINIVVINLAAGGEKAVLVPNRFRNHGVVTVDVTGPASSETFDFLALMVENITAAFRRPAVGCAVFFTDVGYASAPSITGYRYVVTAHYWFDVEV